MSWHVVQPPQPAHQCATRDFAPRARGTYVMCDCGQFWLYKYFSDPRPGEGFDAWARIDTPEWAQ